MIRSFMRLLAALLLAGAGNPAVIHAADPEPAAAPAPQAPAAPVPSTAQDQALPPAPLETVAPASEMVFTERMPGVTQSILWGDPAKGAYGGFTKFKGAAKHPLHTHTSDMQLVVISGVFLYGTADGGVKRLGPGSFLSVSKGREHTSGTEGECLVFETSSGKFEMIPAVPKAAPAAPKVPKKKK